MKALMEAFNLTGEWSVIGGKWCVGVSWIRGSNFVGVGVAGGNWVSDGLHDWGC